MKSVWARALSWISSTRSTLRREGAQLLERLERAPAARARPGACSGRASAARAGRCTSSTALRRKSRLSSACDVGPERTREVEQLHGALGQAGQAAAAERLVGRHARAGQRHDGLEEHRDRALVDQLAHLERPGDEVAAERRGVQERALGVAGSPPRAGRARRGTRSRRRAGRRRRGAGRPSRARGSGTCRCGCRGRGPAASGRRCRSRRGPSRRGPTAARAASPAPRPIRKGSGWSGRALERAVLADLALEHPDAERRRRPPRASSQPVPQLGRLDRAELRVSCRCRNTGIAVRSELMLPLPAET